MQVALQVKTKKRQKKDELHEWIDEIKKEKGCVWCEQKDPKKLSFHHIFPTTKRMTISRMISNRYGKRRIEKEIKKCMVLCNDCHRRIHDNEQRT